MIYVFTHGFNFLHGCSHCQTRITVTVYPVQSAEEARERFPLIVYMPQAEHVNIRVTPHRVGRGKYEIDSQSNKQR
jgi:hypothetical protein